MFETRRTCMTNKSFNNLDFWILILRICIAAFMITHGYPKLEKLIAGGEIKFADPIGIGQTASLVLVVFSEFFCSIFVGIGLFTRSATIPLIFTMGVAAFVTHASDPFGNKEMALMYILIYLTIFIIGPRKFSLDALLRRR
jgi:putative oxidoreductase